MPNACSPTAAPRSPRRRSEDGSNCILLTLQEFNLEKLQLLEQEKAKIRKEYERKEGQVEVKKKM